MNVPKKIHKMQKQIKLATSIVSLTAFVLIIIVHTFWSDGAIKLDEIKQNDSQKYNAGIPSQLAQVAQIDLTQSQYDNPVSNGIVDLGDTNIVRVVKVVDGDTVTVSGIHANTESKVTLRLIGINTPETVDPRKKVECFGKEASSRAKELLTGKNIRIEYDITQDKRDKYGRLLVYVYVEDSNGEEIFFNKKMIEDGYAYEYTYDKPYAYQAEFKNAQKNASEEGRGLWAESTCNGQKIIAQ